MRSTPRRSCAAGYGAGVEINADGEPGPVMDLDEERTKVSGVGDLQAKAELADPDNDDARYRVAEITVWARKAQP